MKRILLLLLVVIGLTSQAQVYNNQWIDYSKTYYKFKVGVSGLCRISQTTLNSIGLGSTPAEHFQLWRNGSQVPLYTSVPSGALGSSDYLEFWGEMNDGKPDNALYLDPDYQLNDKWSLETDTVAFFLTVNPAGNNLRLVNTINNIAGNILPPEPYFMYILGNYYKVRLNPGYANVVGEYVYSSSYDKGEGWSSADIAGLGGKIVVTHPNLFVYNSGPAPVFRLAVSGNAINLRTIAVKINADTIYSQSLDFFNYLKTDIPFSLSTLSSNSAQVEIQNQSTISTDRMTTHKYEIIYPRQFNFGGATNFNFDLPANTNGNYLEISGFNYGSVAPVLYDITNGKRYVTDISDPTLIKIALDASSVDRKLMLVSEDASNLSNITSFQTRDFINYGLPANQGNYIIVSNQALFNGVNGTNPVDDYKVYRSSPAGGSYNAKVYLIDQLIDQFGLGIKNHPNSIRNFLLYARATYNSPPKFVFLVGKGINYPQYRINENKPDVDKLAFVPTFGYPAADNLFSADPGSAIPSIPVGRLSAINAVEIALYLKKIKEFELAQATPSPRIQDKAWMKNVVHVVGASDPTLGVLLENFMLKYKGIISDTLYGANVTTFSKSSSDAVQQLSSDRLQGLFSEGISLLTYFGHSSASTLEFNLDDPANYNNTGKYPVFITLGCNAGNFYNYNPLRFVTKETLSEKFILAPDKGAVGFIASTHFGIVHYLDIYNSRLYNAIGKTNYGETLGEIMVEAIKQVFDLTTQNDYYARFHCEQNTLHGDPAIRLNTFSKPDYVIEDPLLKISPSYISVADGHFKLDAKFLNMGKAIPDKIVIEVKRQYPNQMIQTIYRDTIPGIRYSDSISLDIPIVADRDKGLNVITVTVDADNTVDELFENNNSVRREFFIYEDEARPVYPYNYAIVNKQNIKFVASTANPFSTMKQYNMEIDTTELFNSSFKISKSINSTGGILEFDPGITFTDSTVYYWRVAPVPTTGLPIWNISSFVYLPNSDVGFNQSHFFQHLNSLNNRMTLDSATRRWKFGTITDNLFIRLGTWVTSGATQDASLSVSVNGVARIRNTCWFQSIVFNVFDPITFKPWVNVTVVPGTSAPNNMGQGLYNSLDNNPPFALEPRYHNFEFRYTDTSGRRKAMDFMRDVIPDGAYVVVRNFTLDPNTYTNQTTFPQKFVSDWLADESVYGTGQTIYHYLKNVGLNTIDSFYRPRPWALVYKKNDPSFVPKSIMGDGVYDNPTLSADCFTPDTIGTTVSPIFGPAKAWKQLKWAGNSIDPSSGDDPTIDVIGVQYNGVEDTLYRAINTSQPVYDLSSVNATQYPYLKLKMRNTDSIYYTPFQLRYWRLTYVPVPEGAVQPDITFIYKDTIEVGEPVDFKMQFKNISDVNFDSLRVKLVVIDHNNVPNVIYDGREKPLVVGDTVQILKRIETSHFSGHNDIYIEFNPNDDQPEQYHWNNFAFRNLIVKGDTLNPLLDVTFDGVHILNRDIVSSKPHILVKLKDEAKWLALNDTSLLSIQIRYPDGHLVAYHFDNDTLRFTPAGQPPVVENTAMLDFLPYFPEDGEYQLIVTGKDRSDNKAGNLEYRVAFMVINKPMISNMLNYPNPFTSSTAFVFTITGSETPQNIRIQILTITGKIVRDITKDELGPLHIGRNITEFKWDGTDQYGQKLANGIYLYRVITNLNGKKLDKYKSEDDNTDKYFNKGYGKMYLMR